MEEMTIPAAVTSLRCHQSTSDWQESDSGRIWMDNPLKIRISSSISFRFSHAVSWTRVVRSPLFPGKVRWQCSRTWRTSLKMTWICWSLQFVNVSIKSTHDQGGLQFSRTLYRIPPDRSIHRRHRSGVRESSSSSNQPVKITVKN